MRVRLTEDVKWDLAVVVAEGVNFYEAAEDLDSEVNLDLAIDRAAMGPGAVQAEGMVEYVNLDFGVRRDCRWAGLGAGGGQGRGRDAVQGDGRGDA